MIQLALTGETALLILEPANLRMLREGDPLTLDLSKFGLTGRLVIAYTPDQDWLQLKIKEAMPISDQQIGKLLHEGITHKPIDRGKKAN